MRRQQGFTLIELMVVIVIIGVLAMFAIPQFQNRTASAQVSRVVMETSQLRTAVDLCLMQGINDATKCELGAVKSDLITDTDSKPTLEFKTSNNAKSHAAISATFGQNAATVLHGKKVVWELDKTEGWVCSSTVDDKYATKGCESKKSTATTTSSGG